MIAIFPGVAYLLSFTFGISGPNQLLDQSGWKVWQPERSGSQPASTVISVLMRMFIVSTTRPVLRAICDTFRLNPHPVRLRRTTLSHRERDLAIVPLDTDTWLVLRRRRAVAAGHRARGPGCQRGASRAESFRVSTCQFPAEEAP